MKNKFNTNQLGRWGETLLMNTLNNLDSPFIPTQLGDKFPLLDAFALLEPKVAPGVVCLFQCKATRRFVTKTPQLVAGIALDSLKLTQMKCFRIPIVLTVAVMETNALYYKWIDADSTFPGSRFICDQELTLHALNHSIVPSLLSLQQGS